MAGPQAVVTGSTAAVPSCADTAHDRWAIREKRGLREVVSLCSQLSGLATQGTDLHAVVELVAERLGVGAVVLDTGRDVIAGADAGLRAQLDRIDLPAVLAASARARRAIALRGTDRLASAFVAPVLLGTETVAFLVVGRPDGASEHGLLVAEHAAMICGILVARQRHLAAAVRRARLDLVESLLLTGDRSEPELRNWARHLGIDERVEHTVVTLVPEPAPGGPAAYAERLLTRRTNGIVARRDREVVAIVPVSGDGNLTVDELVDAVRQCRTAVEARFPVSRVSVGVGGVCRTVTDLGRSYAEARLAVETTTRMAGLGGVVSFRDLGIQRLLARIDDVGDLRAFATEVLGELITHERANSTEYLQTLTAYFMANDSPKRTAELLHLHPNTVTYRVRRVEEICGLRLSSYRDRLMIQVALEIVNGLGDAL